MSDVAPELGSPQAAARREHVPLGILFMVASTIVFSGSSALSKWLVASYPPGEVLFTRALGSLLICAVIILPRTGLAVFRTRRLRHHVIRTGSQAVSQTLLVIALLSMLLLKEAVGPARWAALFVGFLGVLIVTNPGAETFQVGALFALGNAV